MRVCSVKNCGRIHYGRGYCQKHWQLLKKYGTAEPTVDDGFVALPKFDNEHVRLSTRSRNKQKRLDAKLAAIRYKGGKCVRCGYSRCPDALTFHHVDPSTKEIAVARLIAKCRDWKVITHELDKTILLCENCHREEHAGFHTSGYEYGKATPVKLREEIKVCSVEGCTRGVYAKTLCSTHYRRYLAGMSLRHDYKNSGHTCSAPGCDGPAKSRGLCRRCYKRMRYHELHGLDRRPKQDPR